MNADDLRDVSERLEALESLAKLFGNSWLAYAKSQIQDEKIRAYLTVFDDAFPGLDHVVEFVRQNAQALATGQDVQENFVGLAQMLRQRTMEETGAEAVEDDADATADEQEDTNEPASAIEEAENEPASAIEEAENEPASTTEESENEDEIKALFG